MKSLLKSLLFVAALIIVYSMGRSIFNPSSTQNNPHPLNSRTTDSEADLTITGLHLTETKGDKLLWEIEADSAQMYQKRQAAQLKNIKLTMYQKQEPVLYLTGDKGWLDMNSRDIAIEGKVTANLQDGIVFETDSLNWQHEKRILSTRDPVKITRANIHILGEGMEADIEAEKININNVVTTIIN